MESIVKHKVRLPLLVAVVFLTFMFTISFCLSGIQNAKAADVVELINPYSDVDWDNWYFSRTNFHGHTTFSDGGNSPAMSIEAYEMLEYDFLAFGDHSWVTYNDKMWNTGDAFPKGLLRPEHNYNLQLVMGQEISTTHHIVSVFSDFHDNKEHKVGDTVNKESPGFNWQDRDGRGRNGTRDNAAYVEGKSFIDGLNWQNGNNDTLPYDRQVVRQPSIDPGYGKEAAIFQAASTYDKLQGRMFFAHPANYWGTSTYGSAYNRAWYVNQFKEFPLLTGFEVFTDDGMYTNSRNYWTQVLDDLMPYRPVWGFGSDDNHTANSIQNIGGVPTLVLNSKIMNAFSTVMVPRKTVAHLQNATDKGQFFAHSFDSLRLGDFPTIEDRMALIPQITRITHDEASHTVTLDVVDGTYDEILWKSNTNRIVGRGKTLKYLNDNGTKIDNIDTYFRAELVQLDRGRTFAWSTDTGAPRSGANPFFEQTGQRIIGTTWTQPFGIGDPSKVNLINQGKLLDMQEVLPGIAAPTPKFASRSETSITLIAPIALANDQKTEFAISTSKTTDGLVWQSGRTFQNLTPGTQYFIFARSAADIDYNAGQPSSPLEVMTAGDTGITEKEGGCNSSAANSGISIFGLLIPLLGVFMFSRKRQRV